MKSATPQLLDDQLIPAMTVREAIFKAFNDDWNSRRIVANGSDAELFGATVMFHLKVPMAMAREVLATIKA